MNLLHVRYQNGATEELTEILEIHTLLNLFYTNKYYINRHLVLTTPSNVSKKQMVPQA